MIPSLNSVKAISKYILHLQFADGLEGSLDVSAMAGRGVFAVWDENDLFFRPYVSETGSISWNELVDIDTVNAYLKLKGISFEEWRQRSLHHATN